MLHRVIPFFCVSLLILIAPVTGFAKDVGTTTTAVELSKAAPDSLWEAVRIQRKKSNSHNLLLFSLGYSFGNANAPLQASESLDGGSNTSTANAPLISLVAELRRHHAFGATVKLALANFGRLTKFAIPTSSGSEDVEVDAPQVRQSLIADLDLQYRFWQPPGLDVLGVVNTGFLFDAERSDYSTEVPDASSYLFVGPALKARFAEQTELRVDLLFGQSEVMTNLELFSGDRRSKDTWRVRPRVRFLLGDGKFEKAAVVLGVWADLGFGAKYGDTYVVFISRIFAKI